VTQQADYARMAVGGLSVALGAAAAVAPGPTARAFGLTDSGPGQPLLVRMVGVRNATMGAATLAASGRHCSPPRREPCRLPVLRHPSEGAVDSRSGRGRERAPLTA